MDQTTASPPQTAVDVRQMITGYWAAQMVYVAAKLGVADLLDSGPRAADDLARAASVHADSLYRLLRALASLGIFREQEDGRFAMTKSAEPLRSAGPGSQRALALMMGEEHFQCWGELLYCVQTGQSAFEKVFGQPIFPYLSEHPEQGAVFDAAMVGVHGRESAAMLDSYDFSDLGTLADVGGGNGSTLAAVLTKHPRLRGILFDLPAVVERARPQLAAAGLTGRCAIVSGDFFASVAGGADAYLLRHIIHDWDDARSIQILTNIRRVIAATGKLLVVESVIPPGNEPSFGKLLDVNMLVVPGGRERTEPQYRDLFRQAGFELTRIAPTAAEVSVIEGRPL